METAIGAALANARAIREATPVTVSSPSPVGRVVAIGDPQTSAERFFGALRANGVLDDDGWVRPDTHLVAMGDYFDYQVSDRQAARVEGVLVLGWLAAHPPERVTILCGNHDLSRVMELVSVDDARFAEAAELGRQIRELPRGARADAEADFRVRFPEIATSGYAARDYNAFTVEQRRLVQRLLLARRFTLALAAHAADGTPVLLTHAGVTTRELGLLGLPDERDPVAIAAALETHLADAIAVVAAGWRSGGSQPLSLEPLHVAGAAGQEGGGLLYHRPADPDRPGADRSWEHAGDRGPRRFDPRTLPLGLVQLVGHTGHSKAASELARWCHPATDDRRGGLRTLRATPTGDVIYRRGIHRGDAGDAIVWLCDPEMHYVASPAHVPVLDLASTPSSTAPRLRYSVRGLVHPASLEHLTEALAALSFVPAPGLELHWRDADIDLSIARAVEVEPDYYPVLGVIESTRDDAIARVVRLARVCEANDIAYQLELALPDRDVLALRHPAT
jgi:hypothetical protein